jgi:hypothetical protein
MIGKVFGHGHFDRAWNGKLAWRRHGDHRFFFAGSLSLLQSCGTTLRFHNNSRPLARSPNQEWILALNLR